MLTSKVLKTYTPRTVSVTFTAGEFTCIYISEEAEHLCTKMCTCLQKFSCYQREGTDIFKRLGIVKPWASPPLTAPDKVYLRILVEGYLSSSGRCDHLTSLQFLYHSTVSDMLCHDPTLLFFPSLITNLSVFWAVTVTFCLTSTESIRKIAQSDVFRLFILTCPQQSWKHLRILICEKLCPANVKCFRLIKLHWMLINLLLTGKVMTSYHDMRLFQPYSQVLCDNIIRNAFIHFS